MSATGRNRRAKSETREAVRRAYLAAIEEEKARLFTIISQAGPAGVPRSVLKGEDHQPTRVALSHLQLDGLVFSSSIGAKGGYLYVATAHRAEHKPLHRRKQQRRNTFPGIPYDANTHCSITDWVVANVALGDQQGIEAADLFDLHPTVKTNTLLPTISHTVDQEGGYP